METKLQSTSLELTQGNTELQTKTRSLEEQKHTNNQLRSTSEKMTARLECAEKTVQDQHSKLNEYQIRDEDHTDQTRQNIQSFTQMVKYQENRYIKSNCIDLSQRIT